MQQSTVAALARGDRRSAVAPMPKQRRKHDPERNASVQERYEQHLIRKRIGDSRYRREHRRLNEYRQAGVPKGGFDADGYRIRFG